MTSLSRRRSAISAIRLLKKKLLQIKGKHGSSSDGVRSVSELQYTVYKT